ncbi:MAG: RodZ domain-containing protein [Pseudomonadota bacterium]
MTDNDVKSFGRYLRSVRLEKGIALEAIAASTRIGWETLSRIEDEDHEKLPAEVFVKGFIRSYAKAVGADGDLAIQDYEKSLAEFRTAAQNQSERLRSHHVFWPRLAMGVLLLAVIVAASIYALSTGEGPSVEPAPASPPPVTTMAATPDSAAVTSLPTPAAVLSPPPAATPSPAPEAAPSPPVTAEPPAKEAPAPAPSAAPPEGPPSEALPAEMTQRLLINTVEETWIKVTTDGMRTTEYMLKPGDHLQLEAEKGFDLLIGNAAGIAMQLNGQSVPILGNSGQVVTIQVP